MMVENVDVTLHYIAIFTHGADAMTPCQSGVVSQAKGFNSIILASTLLVHWQASVSKAPWWLESPTSNSNHCSSDYLASPAGKQATGQDALLIHSEVWWLTRGEVLQGLYEVCLELCKIQPECQACHCSASEKVSTDVFYLLNILICIPSR